MGTLDGQVAVVTGGARGIGAAIGERLRESGAVLAIADLDHGSDPPALDAALRFTVDVADPGAVDRTVSDVRAALGGIDVLVNNAGIFSGLTPKPAVELTLEEWRRVFEVNVFGLFSFCKAAIPVMRDRGGGRIVNIASTAPFKGLPQFLHYTSSKGAVVALTRALARELGRDGITVNAVAPGFTLSEAVTASASLTNALSAPSVAARALARDELPHDVAGAVAFLASPDAAFVTGQTLAVDGGAVFR